MFSGIVCIISRSVCHIMKLPSRCFRRHSNTDCAVHHCADGWRSTRKAGVITHDDTMRWWKGASAGWFIVAEIRCIRIYFELCVFYVHDGCSGCTWRNVAGEVSNNAMTTARYAEKRRPILRATIFWIDYLILQPSLRWRHFLTYLTWHSRSSGGLSSIAFSKMHVT